MDKYNQKKNDLLGMPHGTATHQLRKKIMFDMMQRLKEDICYRCGKKIENIEDFSIEHKIAWQSSENPKEMFFDLKNISFSHIKCNIGAAEQPSKNTGPHGTYWKYTKNGCRCIECTRAHANYEKERRRKKKI